MTEAAPVISARAQRFLARTQGEAEPGFEAFMRQTTAARHADEGGARLPMTLALLAARPVLDRELSGARLQAYAALLGDDLLDAVREAGVEETWRDAMPTLQTLPSPDMLVHRGEELLAKVGESPQVAGLIDLAVRLIRTAPSEAPA